MPTREKLSLSFRAASAKLVHSWATPRSAALLEGREVSVKNGFQFTSSRNVEELRAGRCWDVGMYPTGVLWVCRVHGKDTEGCGWWPWWGWVDGWTWRPSVFSNLNDSMTVRPGGIGGAALASRSCEAAQFLCEFGSPEAMSWVWPSP